MSNSTDTTGCISHRAKTHFFIMYEDYQDIARAVSGKEHENKLAAFWRVLETKTNDRITTLGEVAEEYKKKEQPIPENLLWIEIPYSEFENRARGIFKSSSFQIAAAESERVGFSKSRVCQRPRNPDDPNSPKEDYKEYLFFFGIMQSVLNGGELPTPIEINSPLLKSHNKRKEEKKQKRAIEKNSTPVLKKIEGAIENNNKNNSKVSSKDKEECVDTSLPEGEPTPEHTHTNLNSSTTTKPQTNDIAQVAASLPQGNNEKPQPPHPDKSHTNGQTYPWMTMLDQWDKDYNGGRRSKRDNLTLRHAREWMVEMKLTYQDAKVVRQKIIEHNLHKGKPITFTMVYDHSEWLGEIPKANVPAASSALMPPRVKTREELKREAY